MLQLFAGRTAVQILSALIGPALIFAAGVTAATVHEHRAPWGLAHKRDAAVARADGLAGDLAAERRAHDATRGVAREWMAARAESERLRREEAGQSVAAVEAVQSRCDARVAAARRSAAAIQTILRTGAHYDANGCPQRKLVDPGVLRDAVGP